MSDIGDRISTAAQLACLLEAVQGVDAVDDLFERSVRNDAGENRVR